MTILQGVPRPPKAAMLLAQRIVRDFVHQRVPAGSVLPTERHMAQTYQVGRGTLREALRLLELQGVITFQRGPHGGPVLNDPDAGHVAHTLTLLAQLSGTPYRSVLEVRAAIEPLVTRLATNQMDPATLSELEGTVSTMRRTPPRDHAFWRANKRFHALIAEASGNLVLSLLVDSFLGITDSEAVGVGYPEGCRGSMLEAHHEIYQAIVDGCPQTAADRMFEHITDYERYAERAHPEVLADPVTWKPSQTAHRSR
ncbi:FadR family transcriptional regulator [Planosporangium thailandense]|uniref:FadR family transcriptional regulator n=1 Tax=Planosporangium thailandense TaxID=765197 RepID=A0ABX0Y192_9ACTN|nr:FCD domain-containing protein [Planosporangium thailandense]NJC71861.1 FadR family transcriptional regulator [Planosporangium thailandense]